MWYTGEVTGIFHIGQNLKRADLQMQEQPTLGDNIKMHVAETGLWSWIGFN